MDTAVDVIDQWAQLCDDRRRVSSFSVPVTTTCMEIQHLPFGEITPLPEHWA